MIIEDRFKCDLVIPTFTTNRFAFNLERVWHKIKVKISVEKNTLQIAGCI